MKTTGVNFEDFFKGVQTKTNNANSFGANAIYKSVSEFQNNNEISIYLKSDGITLNRNKIRKHFRTLLGNAVSFQKGKYIVTSKENVKMFMKFCVNIYACFNQQNFMQYDLYSVSNLCKSNKEDNLQYISKQLETIQDYIKNNF
jgi:hypothetical protein